MKSIFLSFFIIIGIETLAQKEQSTKEFQEELQADYKNPEKSPFKENAKDFEGLLFFPIDSSYIIDAEFKKAKRHAIIKFKTSSFRIASYKVYGTLSFQINDKEQTLKLFQSYPVSKEYPDHLFLPITDETSGNITYGGGRYLDVSLKDTKDGNVVLDFNRLYHPYCAYTSGYSCPIPPRENHIGTEINAGVRLFNQEY